MSYGILVDTTKCIGCRGCQVACKRVNKLPGETTTFRSLRTNPPALTADTACLVSFYEVVSSRTRLVWRFVKHQCMHCLEPACVSVCPVAALRKTPEGPVIYDAARCIGCRYCMTACPFNIPKYEWESVTPLIQKCTMCSARVAVGEPPACVKGCPTGALKFGPRAALLAEAHQRISDMPARYVDRVYGEQEVGGTAVLYLADVPFASLGFPAALPAFALPAKTWAVMSLVPGIAGGAAAVTTFAYLLMRRQQGMQRQAAGQAGEVPAGATPGSRVQPPEEVH